jgi:hypothetical protein
MTNIQRGGLRPPAAEGRHDSILPLYFMKSCIFKPIYLYKNTIIFVIHNCNLQNHTVFFCETKQYRFIDH